jgi:hypothetical protein
LSDARPACAAASSTPRPQSPPVLPRARRRACHFSNLHCRRGPLPILSPLRPSAVALSLSSHPRPAQPPASASSSTAVRPTRAAAPGVSTSPARHLDRQRERAPPPVAGLRQGASSVVVNRSLPLLYYRAIEEKICIL